MSNPSPSTESDTFNRKRLLSLDILRGFTMFWIVGAEDIFHALSHHQNNPVSRFLATQLNHRDWSGVTFYDLIFPTFVFIVGFSLVLALGKTIQKEGRSAAIKKVLVRSAILYVLGIFYYGGISEGWEKVRLLGVLQRIALCYLFGSLLFCFFRVKGLCIALGTLLIGYWALMSFVPVPEFGTGNFAEGKNLANYVDKQFLPLFKWDGDHDPEGLLSTLPAIGTCLLGVLTGLFFTQSSHPDQKKVIYLLASGAVLIVLGFLWGIQFPVIKKIWSSSYVLVAGGFSMIFFAVFHQIVEIWKMDRWCIPLLWIGVNPIAIYMAHNLIPFKELAERLAGGPVASALGIWSEPLLTTLVLAFSFLFVRFLYHRKIFLKI